MKYKLLTFFIAAFPVCLAAALTDGGDKGSSFLRQLQERDSVLIADQLSYGAVLEGVPEGSVLMFPEYEKNHLTEGVEVVSPWSLDTLKNKKGRMDIQASITVTSFDEGDYTLPDIKIARLDPDGSTDTLVFEGRTVSVREMPVDTATFVVHDIRPQIDYPLTFAEVAPYAAGLVLIAVLVLVTVLIIRRLRGKRKLAVTPPEPAHIVALRQLDKLRGNKYWAPENQKLYYSGITDALRGYIASRYDIGALEMTTSEIFDALRDTDFPGGYVQNLRQLFETSDFVKFAKLTVDDDYNAKALPLAVRFVTETYQTALDKESQSGASDDGEPIKSKADVL